MYTIRRHIDQVVVKSSLSSKSVLLTVPRQVGKSTLLKHLFADVNQVTFDDDFLLSQAKDDPNLFLMNNPCPLMIDETESISKIIGAMIEQRHVLKLSQRELAELCGIPHSSVARIESGKSSPKLTTIINILDHLGLCLTVSSSVRTANNL